VKQEIKENITFREYEGLKETLENYATKHGIEKAEFYRMCLRKGFEDISKTPIDERYEKLIVMGITEGEYRQILELRKYQPNEIKLNRAIFGNGLEVTMMLKDTGFLNLVKKGLDVFDFLKNKIDNAESRKEAKVLARG
jgi:hypothetical protein